MKIQDVEFRIKSVLPRELLGFFMVMLTIEINGELCPEYMWGDK